MARDEPEAARGETAAGPQRRTKVSTREEHVSLAVPPPGLHLGQLVRFLVLLLGGLALLYFVFRVLGGGAWMVPSLLGCLVAVVLLAAAVYVLLVGLLDRVTVRFSPEQIEVTHSFPWKHTGVMGKKESRGIVIGKPGLVERGYFCREWGRGSRELVVVGKEGMLHFGAGLPASELEWIKDLIQDRFKPAEQEPGPQAEDEEGIIQPPERFWRNVTGYSVFVLLAGLVALALLLAAKAQTESVAWTLLLVLLSGTVAILGYRNYRLERSASGWHRAVVKSLASILELKFRATDTAEVVRRLPDFAFFGGPRQIYNVAWREGEPRKLIVFDYTSAKRWLHRDGVGCALKVENMSGDRVSMRPARRWADFLRWGDLRTPEYPEFDAAYRVRAENKGRTRALLGPEVIAAVMSWEIPESRPWICVAGGMVGLSMPRKHAENDRTMREFYDYGRRVREALEDRIRQLRERPAD
ncbi:MAG: hypothetical protein R6X33_01545 [Candidatus Brocadiia bacterium]